MKWAICLLIGLALTCGLVTAQARVDAIAQAETAQRRAEGERDKALHAVDIAGRDWAKAQFSAFMSTLETAEARRQFARYQRQIAEILSGLPPCIVTLGQDGI